jgi:hypothetical protein
VLSVREEKESGREREGGGGGGGSGFTSSKTRRDAPVWMIRTAYRKAPRLSDMKMKQEKDRRESECIYLPRRRTRIFVFVCTRDMKLSRHNNDIRFFTAA